MFLIMMIWMKIAFSVTWIKISQAWCMKVSRKSWNMCQVTILRWIQQAGGPFSQAEKNWILLTRKSRKDKEFQMGLSQKKNPQNTNSRLHLLVICALWGKKRRKWTNAWKFLTLKSPRLVIRSIRDTWTIRFIKPNSNRGLISDLIKEFTRRQTIKKLKR